MSSSMSDSLAPTVTTEENLPQRPKILEALGYRATVVTRFFAKKARNLPIVGRTVGYVEDTLSPWLEPVIAHAERDGLYLLSLVDSKIHTVSDVAMAWVPFAAKVIPLMQTVLSGEPVETMLVALDRVRTRGVVGSTADIWVEYEPIVKNKSQTIYNLANRLPGLNVVVSVLHDISSPLVSLASDWLVMHSESKDKHEILLLREVSPSSLNSPSALDKGSKPDEPVILDKSSKPNEHYAATEENDSPLKQSSDCSYTGPLETTDVAENSSGEIDLVKGKGEELTSLTTADMKLKFPETMLHEDDEERDEVADLFDTWGMGVKAISPSGLKSLRTHSLKEGTGSRKPPGRPFTTVSFRF